MIPAWKLKRELRRPFIRLAKSAMLPTGYLNTWVHDRHRTRLVTRSEGAIPALQDLAILLIYQPNGILPSTYQQLDFFVSQGVAPIVVVNHPLAERELSRLLEGAHLVIRRPNTGYDFGGYREGIQTIRERGYDPENLFILNDSIWFPVRPDCTFLDQARAASADVYGIFFNDKARRDAHHHLQSYFYRVSGRVLRDQRFHRIWDRMALHDNKDLVIRQHEIRLTDRLRQAGFSIGAYLSPTDLLRAAMALSVQEKRHLVAYQARHDIRTRQSFQALDTSGLSDAAFEAEADLLLAATKLSYYFISSHPYLQLRDLRSPVIKKQRTSECVAQRREILRLGMDRALLPVVGREIRMWDDAQDAESAGAAVEPGGRPAVEPAPQGLTL
ncbi:MAG: hypothetical protein GYB53_05950 [Rhodobacteraceae bacterium]|nr:hypothetical protein [Paracoccaceae bacterium]MBR9820134.1 hypothetical protein [Paracoccaceae bacterium]